MTNFDADQHPRDTAGKFDTKTQSAPEVAALTPTAGIDGFTTIAEHLAKSEHPRGVESDRQRRNEVLHSDLTDLIARDERYTLNAGTDIAAADVVSGAKNLTIALSNFGPMAWIDHEDIDVAGIRMAADPSEDRESAGDWLDTNSEAVREFWIDKDVHMFGGTWEEQRPTITVYLGKEEPVTVGRAKELLDEAPGLVYLRANSDPATSTIPADMAAFVDAYEIDDEDDDDDEDDGI